LETFRASDYATFIEEGIERDSWGKFPYLSKLGRHDGMYRVGPLARLNIVEKIGLPKADQWLHRFKSLGKAQPVHDIIFYHLARCIELVYEFEQSLCYFKHPALSATKTRIPVTRRAGQGVGIVEAPRGTLIHHYSCGSRGEVVQANLIVPTTHNNSSLQQSVTAAAKQVVKDGILDETGRQCIEMAVRAYDPCLSCATHSWDADHRLKIEIQRYENG
jgi:F420-non-reducing hydrogenase large subunit